LALDLRFLILDILTYCTDARKPKFKISIDDCSREIATTVSGIVRRSKCPATRVLGTLQTVWPLALRPSPLQWHERNFVKSCLERFFPLDFLALLVIAVAKCPKELHVFNVQRVDRSGNHTKTSQQSKTARQVSSYLPPVRNDEQALVSDEMTLPVFIQLDETVHT
jgi:hypothetical protein